MPVAFLPTAPLGVPRVRLENTFLGAEGVGPTTEQRLWAEGITRWADFEPGHLGDRRGPHVASHLTEARTRLDTRDVEYFFDRLPDTSHWRVYDNFREDTCFFDIETTGLDRHRHDVTTISFHRAGTTETLVRGRDLTADRVRDVFADASVLVTYNGGRFDIPFLETTLDITVQTPHLDVMGLCHQLDIYGGMDGAETALDIDRSLPDIDGEDAVRLWHDARQGVDGALETLIRYNQEDAKNLRPLLDAVTDRLHDQVFVE